MVKDRQDKNKESHMSEHHRTYHKPWECCQLTKRNEDKLRPMKVQTPDQITSKMKQLEKELTQR